MIVSSLVASLHFLAIGIGFGSVFMRGRYFKALALKTESQESLKGLFVADNMWGLAALLWISTGLLRAFAGLEKGTHWYLQNPMFHLKLTLFALVFILELAPMIALVKLRITRKKNPLATLPSAQWIRYRKLNHFEAILILLIVFVASAMARGIGMN